MNSLLRPIGISKISSIIRSANWALIRLSSISPVFDDLFGKLVSSPELGKEREEIRKGLRSLLKEKHVVFYRILGNRIRIVRILHGSRDLRTFLT